MLDSAEKYEVLDVTGLERFITGDVLPARDLRGDGSARALKYEDLLFLHEARLEREAVSSVSGVTVSPYGRRLNRFAFNSAAGTSSFSSRIISPNATSDNGGWCFIDPAATFAASTSYSTVQKSLTALVRDKSFSLLDTSASGAALKADCLRRAYANTLRLSRTYRPVPASGTVTVTETTTYVQEDGTQSSSSVTKEGATILYSTTPATRVGSANVRCSFAYHDVPSSRWVSQSRWLYLIEVARYDSEATPADCAWLLLSRVGGNNAITAPNLENVARTGASYYGTYNAAPYYCESGGVAVSLVMMGVVVDHSFPAEVKSLGWDWQPSA